MPRYFFHIRDLDGLVPDEEGQELASIVAARQEAMLSAYDIAGEKLRNGETIAGETIEITDEGGSLLEAVPLISLASPKAKR